MAVAAKGLWRTETENKESRSWTVASEAAVQRNTLAWSFPQNLCGTTGSIQGLRRGICLGSTHSRKRWGHGMGVGRLSRGILCPRRRERSPHCPYNSFPLSSSCVNSFRNYTLYFAKEKGDPPPHTKFSKPAEDSWNLFVCSEKGAWQNVQENCQNRNTWTIMTIQLSEYSL